MDPSSFKTYQPSELMSLLSEKAKLEAEKAYNDHLSQVEKSPIPLKKRILAIVTLILLAGVAAGLIFYNSGALKANAFSWRGIIAGSVPLFMALCPAGYVHYYEKTIRLQKENNRKLKETHQKDAEAAKQKSFLYSAADEIGPLLEPNEVFFVGLEDQGIECISSKKNQLRRQSSYVTFDNKNGLNQGQFKSINQSLFQRSPKVLSLEELQIKKKNREEELQARKKQKETTGQDPLILSQEDSKILKELKLSFLPLPWAMPTFTLLLAQKRTGEWKLAIPFKEPEAWYENVEHLLRLLKMTNQEQILQFLDANLAAANDIPNIESKKLHALAQKYSLKDLEDKLFYEMASLTNTDSHWKLRAPWRMHTDLLLSNQKVERIDSIKERIDFSQVTHLVCEGNLKEAVELLQKLSSNLPNLKVITFCMGDNRFIPVQNVMDAIKISESVLKNVQMIEVQDPLIKNWLLSLETENFKCVPGLKEPIFVRTNANVVELCKEFEIQITQEQ